MPFVPSNARCGRWYPIRAQCPLRDLLWPHLQISVTISSPSQKRDVGVEGTALPPAGSSPSSDLPSGQETSLQVQRTLETPPSESLVAMGCLHPISGCAQSAPQSCSVRQILPALCTAALSSRGFCWGMIVAFPAFSSTPDAMALNPATLVTAVQIQISTITSFSPIFGLSHS